MLATLLQCFRANTSVPAPVAANYVSASLSCLFLSHAFAAITRRGGSMTVDIPKDGTVPEDFVIASSARLQHISRVAQAASLQDDEVIPHGLHKAKVGCWCLHACVAPRT